MAKRIPDLTAEELNALARGAWAHEAEESLRQGLPVTYVEDGKLYRRWPDGRRECIATEDSAVPDIVPMPVPLDIPEDPPAPTSESIEKLALLRGSIEKQKQRVLQMSLVTSLIKRHTTGLPARAGRMRKGRSRTNEAGIPSGSERGRDKADTADD